MSEHAKWFHFFEQQRTLTGETRDQILFRFWVSQKDKEILTDKFNAQFGGDDEQDRRAVDSQDTSQS